jgi:hypothetical protein
MSESESQPALAAVEIKQGARQVLTLAENDVGKYLDPGELLDALENGFR